MIRIVGRCSKCNDGKPCLLYNYNPSLCLWHTFEYPELTNNLLKSTQMDKKEIEILVNKYFLEWKKTNFLATNSFFENHLLNILPNRKFTFIQHVTFNSSHGEWILIN